MDVVVFNIVLHFVGHGPAIFCETSITLVYVIAVVCNGIFVTANELRSRSIRRVVVSSLVRTSVRLSNSPSDCEVSICSNISGAKVCLECGDVGYFRSVIPTSVVRFCRCVKIRQDINDEPSADCATLHPLLSIGCLLGPGSRSPFMSGSDKSTGVCNFGCLGASNGCCICRGRGCVPCNFSCGCCVDCSFLKGCSSAGHIGVVLGNVLLASRRVGGCNRLVRGLRATRSGCLRGSVNAALSIDSTSLACSYRRLGSATTARFGASGAKFATGICHRGTGLIFFSIPCSSN